jgi:hypothetical protein
MMGASGAACGARAGVSQRSRRLGAARVDMRGLESWRRGKVSRRVFYLTLV